MLRRSFALLLVLALVVTAFTGCSQRQNNLKLPADSKLDKTNTTETAEAEEKRTIQKLTYNIGYDLETMDPQLNSTVEGSLVLCNTFEGLVTFDENLNPIPGAAESWKVSDDGLIWTFNIRENARWSDGKPVTARDFQYAWRRAVDPNIPCDYCYMLDLVKNSKKIYTGKGSPEELGVKVINDKTLEVTLEAAASYMAEIFGYTTLFPVRQDIIEKNPERWAFTPELAVSNGPFKLVEYIQNDGIRLVPNEYYWDRKNVKLEEINFLFIQEASTALSTMEAGNIDGIDIVPSQEIPRLQAERDDFIIAPYLGVYYYAFNVKRKPFDDVLVRKAFTLAIDRNAIVTAVTLGGELPATGFVPQGLKIQNEDFRKTGGNYGIDPIKAQVEEARNLLAEAGYPNGKGFPKVTLQYNIDQNHKKIAEAIQQMWKKNLNVNVELKNIEAKVFQIAIEKGEFQIARAGWIGDYNHPMTFLDLFLSKSGNNYTRWNNGEYDRLISEIKVTSDENRAIELMHKAENMIMENMIIMPIYYYTYPMMMGKHVKGWYRSPLGNIYFKNAYIEK